MHKRITVDRVLRAVERSMRDLASPGFCIHCGTSTDGVEPDARRYPCAKCGQTAVYGAEELLIMLS